MFKAANEGNAKVYFWDFGIPSVGLRPYTVYGVGREIGMTSGPTKAIKATVLKRPYTVAFTGHSSFLYVKDLARIFIDVARSPVTEALTLNVRGTIDTVENFLDSLKELFPGGAMHVDCQGTPLPFAYDLDETGLQQLLGAENIPQTSIRDGIEQTARRFRRLAKAGRLHADDLAS